MAYMPDRTAKLTAYARRLSDDLEKDMSYQKGDFGAYWQPVRPELGDVIRARATAAREFLRTYAGPDSRWTTDVDAVFLHEDSFTSMAGNARAIGSHLGAWADQVDAEIVSIVGARALAEIEVVETDVMAQVQRLLDDKGVHPAAPIALAGAALEVALRSTVEAHGLPMPGKPSISSFSGALRGANIITVQDVKDIEQCAGLRNLARTVSSTPSAWNVLDAAADQPALAPA